MPDDKPKWQTYDPAWLVALVREQYPEEPALAEALTRCTRYCQEGRGYHRFVDGDWQSARNVLLHHRREGPLVLDVLEDGRIAGVELIKRI